VESVLFRVKVRAVGRAARPREADALPRLCGVRVLVPSVLPAIGFSSCDQLEACGPGRAWEARLPKQTLGLQGRGIPPGEARQAFVIFVNFVVKSCAAVRSCPWQLRALPW
jgi:hypothetical protein